MQIVIQTDDVRDIAINCTDTLIDKGLVPAVAGDGDQSCWEVQDTIEEIISKLLTERHGITVVNDRVQ